MSTIEKVALESIGELAALREEYERLQHKYDAQTEHAAFQVLKGNEYREQRDALAEALRGMLLSIEGPACCTALDVNGNDAWPRINDAASKARAALAKLESSV